MGSKAAFVYFVRICLNSVYRANFFLENIYKYTCANNFRKTSKYIDEEKTELKVRLTDTVTGKDALSC